MNKRSKISKLVWNYLISLKIWKDEFQKNEHVLLSILY